MKRVLLWNWKKISGKWEVLGPSREVEMDNSLSNRGMNKNIEAVYQISWKHG